MTDDLRERLNDLASEMPPLHAPPGLEGRVRRRQAGAVLVGVVAVCLVVAGIRLGAGAFDGGGVVPGGPVSALYPWAVSAPPASSALQAPESIAVMPSGEVLISEWYGNRIDALAPDGSLWVIAGTGAQGYSGDGGVATSAMLSHTAAMVRDADGNILFVDNGNNCIRKIDPTGTISTIAGVCGQAGTSGDGGPATDALLSRPVGLVLDPAGGFFFSDNDFGLVRHVDAAGRMTTIAGAGDVSPLDAGPDGVHAALLDLGRTGYLLRDPSGNLYVTDLQLNIVVKIDPAGMATVVAGTGAAGYTGDGGPATRALLNFPTGLAMNARGDLYVSDTANNVIRMIGTDGVIRTVAGTGPPGDRGNGGPATAARLAAPAGIAVDPAGNLYISDQNNDRVRRVNTSGVIETVAG